MTQERLDADPLLDVLVELRDLKVRLASAIATVSEAIAEQGHKGRTAPNDLGVAGTLCHDFAPGPADATCSDVGQDEP